MARLPIPGSDDGTWGEVLNEYLGVSHAADGTLNAGVVSDPQVSSLSQSKITNLTSDLAAKADDATVLHKAGNETVTGTKTFSAAPVISTISNTGVLTLPTSTDTLVGRSTSDTLTNKRITPRVTTVTSSSTLAPNSDTTDLYIVSALAVTAAFGAPTGTPVEGQSLVIRVKDDGTARALTWNAIYRAIGLVLPATTVASKTLYVGCKYNALDSKWDVIAVAQE